MVSGSPDDHQRTFLKLLFVAVATLMESSLKEAVEAFSSAKTLKGKLKDSPH